MPILSSIERKSIRGRLLVALVYGLLLAGAATMVYPFGLMIAGSTKSAVDTPDSRLVPAYLTCDDALWTKYSEGLFNESIGRIRQVHNLDASTFAKVTPPPEINDELVAAWREFLSSADLPLHCFAPGHLAAPVSKTSPKAQRSLKKYFVANYGDDIFDVNKALGTEFSGWYAFKVLPAEFLSRRQRWLESDFAVAMREFQARQPMHSRIYTNIDGFYVRTFLRNQYGRKIESYNKAHGTKYESYEQVHLTRRLPGEGYTDKEREDWTVFVRSLLNLFWIRADADALGDYQAFLQAKYVGDIRALNRNHRTSYASFNDVPLVTDCAVDGAPLADWDAFIQGWKDPDTGKMHMMPVEHLRVHSTEFLFRDYLKTKHGSLAGVNAAFKTSQGEPFRSWLDILPPQRQLHYQEFLQRKHVWRWEYTVRNFVTVIDYIVLRGRGLLNTTIYCTLAVLASLIVNPLAAYALSRYKPPSAYKILLFLMLTMAFPPMVMQIPTFLMLREFNLLNTFWALILPGLANGYSIFLLKGFFDSLPKELYESASLDGAGEFRIFFQITMALSKPILAVIALNAFTMAYSNFMLALLICQDQGMWTLMVWMYQLQQDSGQGVIYASLLIAAIPTFLIFAFCQNIIMRGIAVPVEK